MRTGEPERRTVLTRWLAVPAIAAVLLASACTGTAPDTATPSNAPDSDTSLLPSGETLSPGCLAAASPPTKGGLDLYIAWFEYYSDSKLSDPIWHVVFRNTSELAAVNGTVTPKYILDGKDVTSKMGEDAQEDLPFFGFSSPGDLGTLQRLVRIPQKWRHRVEFSATITASYWCHPAPASS